MQTKWSRMPQMPEWHHQLQYALETTISLIINWSTILSTGGQDTKHDRRLLTNFITSGNGEGSFEIKLGKAVELCDKLFESRICTENGLQLLQTEQGRSVGARKCR